MGGWAGRPAGMAGEPASRHDLQQKRPKGGAFVLEIGL